ncbi:DUF559 domain-containing protein [Candidatus Gottesmanbacteria bacterium]|nr:DUF559 domain-containing protein [Candidatus Gottesmanbacteria bacterium]
MRSPSFKYSRNLKDYARNLRRRQTDAERLLWWRLRNRQLAGFKFRRQFPIADYIVDFYCDEKKLAIEVDGGQHTTPKYRQYDIKRTYPRVSHFD